MQSRVAIVEDDPHLANTLQKILASAGYQPALVSIDGEDYLRYLASFDLIILDIGLPGTSGLELAKHLRRGSAVPIILISGTGAPKVGVTALRSGGDDFVKKPFDIEELVERIGALLRRSNHKGRSIRYREIGTWMIDFASHTLNDQGTGATLHLTERECAILGILLDSPGVCVSRERMATIVCGRDWNPLDRSIDVHVSNLRKKLKSGNVWQIEITSLRNRGYLAALAAVETPQSVCDGDQRVAP